MTFTDLSAFITGQGEGETYRRVGGSAGRRGGKRIGGSACRRVCFTGLCLIEEQNGATPLNENADTPTRRHADTFPPNADTPTRRYVSPPGLEQMFDRAQSFAHRGVTKVALSDLSESRFRPHLGQDFQDGWRRDHVVFPADYQDTRSITGRSAV
jgi:hypothetical protein